MKRNTDRRYLCSDIALYSTWTCLRGDRLGRALFSGWGMAKEKRRALLLAFLFFCRPPPPHTHTTHTQSLFLDSLSRVASLAHAHPRLPAVVQTKNWLFLLISVLLDTCAPKQCSPSSSAYCRLAHPLHPTENGQGQSCQSGALFLKMRQEAGETQT